MKIPTGNYNLSRDITCTVTGVDPDTCIPTNYDIILTVVLYLYTYRKRSKKGRE